ncbi:MAG: hypothetical protein AB4060_14135 [Crocosphaera sp.]
MFEIVGSRHLSNEKSGDSLDKYLVVEKFNQAICGDLDSFLLQNLFASDDDSLSAAVVGKVPQNNTVRLIYEMISLRNFAVRDGRLILPKAIKAQAIELFEIYQRFGLVAPDAINRTIFLSDIWSFHSVFYEIKKHQSIFNNLYKFNPYQHFSSLINMALQEDISLVSPTIEAVKSVSERFNDKTEFRNLLVELMPNIALNKYPRVVIPIKSLKDLDNRVKIIKKIKDVIDFRHSISESYQGMLFIQFTQGIGGTGNFILNNNYDLLKEGKDTIPLKDIVGFLEWLNEKNVVSAMEITPFLLIDTSYSYGVVMTSEEIGIIGMREQIMGKNKSFLGFRINANKCNTLIPNYEVDISFKLAQYFYSKKFYTSSGITFGIDFFKYKEEEEQQQLALGVSEVNIRMDGTMPYMGLFYKFPRWYEQLIQNKISIELRHNILVDKSIGTTKEVVNLLLSENIIFADSSSPYGVVLLTPLIKFSNKQFLFMGFCEKTDEERDGLINRVSQTLFKKAKTFTAISLSSLN